MIATPLLAALLFAQIQTPTVEVEGYTAAGEYVRLRGRMLGAVYVGCDAGPCLHVEAAGVAVVGDVIFRSGTDVEVMTR